MLKLTNTLTGKQEIFEPADGRTVRMYTCGPTVYNFAHIGNLRTFVWEDILRRHLSSKWKMNHVMNLTDIDDKIINRSIEKGYAYREGDSIYYRISRFPNYGRLSNLDKRELKVGARIDADEYEKETPQDFVLW